MRPVGVERHTDRVRPDDFVANTVVVDVEPASIGKLGGQFVGLGVGKQFAVDQNAAAASDFMVRDTTCVGNRAAGRGGGFMCVVDCWRGEEPMGGRWCVCCVERW